MDPYAAPQPLLERLARFIRQYPHLPLVLCLGVFFLWYAVLPLAVRLLYVVVLMALNYGLAAGFLRVLRWRTGADHAVSRWPELLIAAGLSLGLFFADGLPLPALILVGALLCWALVQALLANTGSFFAAIVGLALVLAIFVNYRLVYLGERAYLFVLSRPQPARVRAPRYRWVLDPATRRAELIGGGETLQVRLPAGLFLHDLDYLPALQRSPRGHVLGTISASATDARKSPLLVFYRLNTSIPETPADYRKSFEVYLQILERRGDLLRIESLGKQELAPPRSGVRLSGLSWRARDTGIGRQVRFTFYLFLSARGRQFAVVVRERYYPGLRHHPDVLLILRALRWKRVRQASELPAARIGECAVHVLQGQIEFVHVEDAIFADQIVRSPLEALLAD